MYFQMYSKVNKPFIAVTCTNGISLVYIGVYYGRLTPLRAYKFFTDDIYTKA